MYISDKLGASIDIHKSNIPYTLTLRLITLYCIGHTWYALLFSTCYFPPSTNPFDSGLATEFSTASRSLSCPSPFRKICWIKIFQFNSCFSMHMLPPLSQIIYPYLTTWFRKFNQKQIFAEEP